MRFLKDLVDLVSYEALSDLFLDSFSTPAHLLDSFLSGGYDHAVNKALDYPIGTVFLFNLVYFQFQALIEIVKSNNVLISDHHLIKFGDLFYGLTIFGYPSGSIEDSLSAVELLLTLGPSFCQFLT